MQPVPQLPECVCGSLRQVTRAITQIYDEALRPSGMRAMQFHLLMTIRAMETATASQLGTLLTIDQTTLTRSLVLLEQQGWVERRPLKDKRQKAVVLTDAGRAALEMAQPLWQTVQASVLKQIGDANWQAAREPLSRLLTIAGGSAEASAMPRSAKPRSREAKLRRREEKPKSSGR
jgi:DNA-binding MarR family transcriptional regulator